MNAEHTQLITRLLDAVGQGESAARERLWEAVYRELHGMAAAVFAREAPGRTLQPTALVHEAYLRLFTGVESQAGTPAPHGPRFENRRHFFAAAAEAMRRILVDDARRRGRVKRGGIASGQPPESGDAGTENPESPAVRRQRVAAEDYADATMNADATDLIALDEALAKLESVRPEWAEVVKLRFFAGLDVEQTAEAAGIGARTVEKYWRAARAWLHEAMTGEG